MIKQVIILFLIAVFVTVAMAEEAVSVIDKMAAENPAVQRQISLGGNFYPTYVNMKAGNWKIAKNNLEELKVELQSSNYNVPGLAPDKAKEMVAALESEIIPNVVKAKADAQKADVAAWESSDAGKETRSKMNKYDKKYSSINVNQFAAMATFPKIQSVLDDMQTYKELAGGTPGYKGEDNPCVSVVGYYHDGFIDKFDLSESDQLQKFTSAMKATHDCKFSFTTLSKQYDLLRYGLPVAMQNSQKNAAVAAQSKAAKKQARTDAMAQAKKKQDSPACQKMLALQSYCKDIAYQKATNLAAQNEQELETRSGVKNLTRSRKIASSQMYVEKAIVQDQGLYEKYNVPVPSLSVCKVHQRNPAGVDFDVDDDSKKVIDDEMKKNCGYVSSYAY